nr:hypothetical protein [Angustibacter aerolatus]
MLPLLRAGLVVGVTSNPTILDRSDRGAKDFVQPVRDVRRGGRAGGVLPDLGRHHRADGRQRRTCAGARRPRRREACRPPWPASPPPRRCAAQAPRPW